MNILVLDVGTSSMRGVLFSGEGRILYTVQEKYSLISAGEGRIEQDPQVLLNDMIQIVGAAAAYGKQHGEEIHAVALTSQRSSVIPLDQNGLALANAQMWQDRRTLPICRRMEKYNHEIFQICGSRVNPVFSGTKMRWLKEQEPGLYDRAWKLAVIPDYLICHMTGNFYTDYTYGSRSLLMNLRDCAWDERLLKLFDLDQEKLCELKAPGSVMGGVTRAFAEKTGLKEGIPVISCGGDQQCGMLGQGVTGKGKVSLTLGTGGFLLTVCDRVPDDLSWNVICNASSDEGSYVLEANILTCASAVEWFRKNFCREDTEFYQTLNRVLQEIPQGANGCMALPYFQGRSTPDWNSMATATFFNLTLSTTREDMMKALLEGVCMEIQNNIRNFEKYVPIYEILVSGGLSRSEAFNQMQADVYGKTIRRAESAESTATGAWMLASRTLGCAQSLEEAYRMVSGDTEQESYRSDQEICEFYRGLRREMNHIYQKLWME